MRSFCFWHSLSYSPEDKNFLGKIWSRDPSCKGPISDEKSLHEVKTDYKEVSIIFFVLHVTDVTDFILQLNQGFTFKDEKLICHPCRGITPSKVCEACGGDFSQGEKKVGYQSKTFHEKCFVCDECKQPIGTQQFIRKDDKRLCGKCYDTGYAKVSYS